MLLSGLNKATKKASVKEMMNYEASPCQCWVCVEYCTAGHTHEHTLFLADIHTFTHFTDVPQ